MQASRDKDDCLTLFSNNRGRWRRGNDLDVKTTHEHYKNGEPIMDPHMN